jgi:hypothetical protein
MSAGELSTDSTIGELFTVAGDSCSDPDVEEVIRMVAGSCETSTAGIAIDRIVGRSAFIGGWYCPASDSPDEVSFELLAVTGVNPVAIFSII